MGVAATVPARGRPAPRSRRFWGVCGGAAALTAGLVAAAVAASGTTSDPLLAATVRALIPGVPMAVGAYAWTVRARPAFALLLFWSGAAWFVTTLAESTDPALYTLGRAAGWFVPVLFSWLLLAFPSGRLPEARDRRIVGAMALVVAVFFVPRLVLAETFAVPSVFTSCTEDCPSNAPFALDAEPAFVQGLLVPLGAAAVVLVQIATLLRLRARFRGASRHTRRAMAPVLTVAAAAVVLSAASVVAREAGGADEAARALAWAQGLALPAISAAFLSGLLRQRLFAARALERLALCLKTLPDASTLRSAFAEAFSDPRLDVVFASGDPARPWCDAQGRPAGIAGPADPRATTEVRHQGRIVAAVTHDPELLEDRELLSAGTAMAAVVLDNQRLAAESEATERELRRSRARLAATAEQERRRIERDLHDGAQQRLVALRIELGLTEELVHRAPERAVERIHALAAEVDAALDEVRALAHGVHPPILADRGLPEALRAAAGPLPLRIDVDARDVGRYPAETESAVYFCVLEAIQNVLKHAPGAHRAVVTLTGAPDGLRFGVSDDGAGAPGGVIHPGAGLTNMRDRLAAVGGTVRVTSTPRIGTAVRGHVPARTPQELA